MNLYGFAAGFPINNEDPFGLKPNWLNVVSGILAMIGNWASPNDNSIVAPFREAAKDAEIVQTVTERSKGLTRGMKVLIEPVATGGTTPAVVSGGTKALGAKIAPKLLTAGAAAGSEIGGAVLGILLTPTENKSLPASVCRVEKCDPTIKVTPDKP
jgi:hypothetical protein